MPQLHPFVFLSLAVAGLAGACTTDGTGAGQGGNTLFGRQVGLTTTVPEPADFVREGRSTAAPDYIPVGHQPAQRPVARRDAAGAQQLEKDLDAARQRSRGFATRPVPRSSYDGRVPPRPVAPKPESRAD